MIQVTCAVVPPKAAAAAEEKAAAAPQTLPESESESEPAPAPAESEETEVVFRSPLPDIEIEDHLLLHEYCLLSRLPEHQDRPCLIDGITGKTLTYADVAAAAQAAAQGLTRQGLRDGAVVMLLLGNSMEFVVSFLGASMAGCVATTANPFCTAADIAKQATASNCRLVITTAACVPKLAGLAGVKVVTVDEPPAGATTDCLRFADLVADDEDTVAPPPPPPPPHVDDPVALPFSSGTTGLPKGVILTHRSLVTSVAQQVDGANPNLHLAPADVVLCVLPLFHIYSLNSVLLCSLRVGAAVLLLPKFEMGSLLSCVQKHRVSVAAVVPPIVVAMAKSTVADDHDLSSVRVVLSGAAPLGPELEHALRRRLPNALFGQGYGMTEAGPVLAMCTAFAKEPLPAKSGSCGCVVRNAEMKIVDLDSGKSLPRNRSGEICIRGKQIMKGYLKDPEATARTIDSEGWLHTGDVGYVDDDGEVFIVDRVKEIIKFKGFQVPPAELEALLVSHSSVKDAAVVPLRDEAAGELPVAYVVKAEGADNLTEDELKQFVAKEVVYYKRIHRVIFTQSIPKSPTGKILRRDLRDKLNSCLPPPPAPAPVDSNSKK